MLLKKWCKKIVTGCNSVAAKTTYKESPSIQNYGTLHFPFGSSSKASTHSTHTSPHLYVNQWVWVTIANMANFFVYGLRLFFFFALKFFSQSIFICPINLLNFVRFPVQTALSIQLDFSTQWIVYSNLRSFWFLSMNLCHFLRFLKCFKFLIVLTTWMDPKT